MNKTFKNKIIFRLVYRLLGLFTIIGGYRYSTECYGAEIIYLCDKNRAPICEFVFDSTSSSLMVIKFYIRRDILR
jgi:hypothetical protein